MSKAKNRLNKVFELLQYPNKELHKKKEHFISKGMPNPGITNELEKIREQKQKINRTK